MTEIERVAFKRTRKVLFLIIVNSRHFGSCPRTALSMDKDFGLAEKVKVLSWTLVRLYLARPHLARVVLCAIR